MKYSPPFICLLFVCFLMSAARQKPGGKSLDCSLCLVRTGGDHCDEVGQSSYLFSIIIDAQRHDIYTAGG